MRTATETRRDSVSSDDGATSSGRERIFSNVSKDQLPVKLVTKEVLKSAASQRQDGGNTTDEEQPISTLQAQSHSSLESPGPFDESKKQ
ncbi:hypothetical protein C0J52_07996 [Blattella germanica]|nr:hypothetical protein C0J52_07996 [Blattella germanica]